MTEFEGGSPASRPPRSAFEFPLSALPGLMVLAGGAFAWWLALPAPQAPVDLSFAGGFLGILLGLLWLLWPRHRRNHRVLIAGLALGLGLRVFLFAAVDPFALSDDAARYAFEGEVLAAGMSPWHHAPDSPRLDAIVADRDLESLRAAVNHPEIATIYPPLAEGIFALCAGVARLCGVETLSVWRLFAQLGDILVLVLLAAFMRLRTKGAETEWGWLMAWWLNPLVLSEVTISAHLDVWAVAALTAGLLALESKRVALAAAALGAAVFVKIVAALLLPLFFFRSSWRGFALGMTPWLIAGALCLAWFSKRPEVAPALATSSPAFDQSQDAEVSRAEGIQDWNRVLGHYRLDLQPGHPLSARHLYFDGRGLIAEDLSSDASSPADPLFYEIGEDGGLRVVDRASTQIPLRISTRRQHILLAHPAGTIIGHKGEESPLMGLRQYASRWTAHAPLTRWLAALLDERPREGQEAARRKLAWLIIALGFILGFLGRWGPITRVTHIAGTLLAVFWIAAPALYPWYLLWILPLAILDRRPALFLWATLFPLFHLVTPALDSRPSLAEGALIGVVSLAFIIDLLRRRRR